MNIQLKGGPKKSTILRTLLITLLILSVPLLAMAISGLLQDSSNSASRAVNWDYLDFIVMGLLIFSIGLIYEFFKVRVKNPDRRFVVKVALLIVFILIWAEMAVGLFGSPIAGN